MFNIIILLEEAYRILKFYYITKYTIAFTVLIILKSQFYIQKSTQEKKILCLKRIF